MSDTDDAEKKFLAEWTATWSELVKDIPPERARRLHALVIEIATLVFDAGGDIPAPGPWLRRVASTAQIAESP